MSQPPSPTADLLAGLLVDRWMPDAVRDDRQASLDKNSANSPCCPKAE